ncbi:MAG: hypothetical protein ABIF89_00005, partial [bacterium]
MLMTVIFWFIKIIKTIFFWLYFWQLKEYHLRRFIAHFRTIRGWALVFGRISIIKIILLFWGILGESGFLKLNFETIFVWIVFSVYVFETFKAANDFQKKNLKKPLLTKKIVILSILCFMFFLSIFIAFNGFGDQAVFLVP